MRTWDEKPMLSEYARLVAKVDETTRAIAARVRDQLACAPGCAACCQVDLTLTRVEAAAVREHASRLDDPSKQRIAARADRADGRCVMLDDDDRCAIFEARPIVCRTQGLPLLYPNDVVPVSAVLRHTDRGAITACPLNFRSRIPELADAIDAARLDAMLGIVDRLAASASGIGAPERVPMRAIARELA